MYSSQEIPGGGILSEPIITVTLKNPVKIGDVVFEPRACTFAKLIEPFVERIANFAVREDDLLIASVPKSGTTWTQEMCWLIQNDFDFEKAKSIDTGVRCPYLELSGMVPSSSDSVAEMEKLESPRCVQTHLPLPFLPKQIWTKNSKVVYVVRDPRDAGISLYEHMRNWKNLTVTKDEFFERFMNGKLIYMPYFDHVLEYWKIRDQSNLLILTYEEMKTNLKEVILRTCKFLKKNITDEQLTKMLHHLSFDSMRNNKACSRDYQREMICDGDIDNDNTFRFIRRGIVGSHKDELSPEIISSYNEWMRKNLTNSDCNLFKI